MNLEPAMRIIEIILILEVLAVVQTSHVRNAKARIRHEIAEIRKDSGRMGHSSRDSRRFTSRRKAGNYFTPWTGWSKCDPSCIKSRERYCKIKRKCGHTKHIEEKYCKDCQASRQPSFEQTFPVQTHHHPITQMQTAVSAPAHPVVPIHSPYPHTAIPVHPPIHHTPIVHTPIIPQPPIIEPIPTFPSSSSRLLLPVFQEIHENREENRDYFVIKKRPRYRKKRKPIVIEVDDYEDLQDEVDELQFNKHYIKAYRNKYWDRQGHRPRYEKDYYDSYDDYDQTRKRNLGSDTEGFDYDDPGQFEGNLTPSQKRNDYEDEYTDDELFDGELFDTRNTSRGFQREKAVFETPPRYRRVYTKWSKWTKCSQKCTTRRYKKCRMKDICGKEVLREIAYCYTEGSFCQQWLEGQIQKNQANDLKPMAMASRRKDVTTSNAIGNDYILSGKGYRGPEYRPLRLKCGIPNIRNNRRNMNNLLKIIGGKPARKGEWPWQVVIFNRFKEAFCGGTLIAPRWILTAAHCVRKVLYVRLGEHNLDYQDGTEMEFRVVKSIKHPNYDKRTVDSDIALLRLPKPMNSTTWIGFSCMPRPYQPLPKNIQCTVIGWGKRRNRDQAGTSVLHQAEVPIIPMDNCKAVYYDYTITKNMFCAGHKRGRIDTCAGDSGGPLLCKDTTKPNHPWTIFGITSFGDGCAKKNKFGIYAKVPNYVDWVWSVINCNGNCRTPSHKRT